MVLQYFTCVSCGGLVRQRLADPDAPWEEPVIEVLIPATPPCPHPWWDESGLFYKEISSEAAERLLAEQPPASPD